MKTFVGALVSFAFALNGAIAGDFPFAEASNRYSIRLLKSLDNKEQGNVCFSPVVSLVLVAQLYAGLDARTREVIRQEMDWRDDGEAVHDGYAALMKEIPESVFSTSFQFFTQKGVQFSEPYEDILKKYSTRLSIVDWTDGRVDLKAETINESLSQFSKGRIARLLSRERLEQAIESHLEVRSAPIVPVSALKMQLTLNKTDEPTHLVFHHSDGKSEIVNGARSVRDFKILRVESGLEMVELEFQEKGFVVDFILPPRASSLSKFVSHLTPELLTHYLSRLEKTSGQISFPSLRMQSSLSVYKGLPENVRWREADTRRMGDPGEFRTIGMADISQDFWFDLSGKGTEAAAAAVLTIGGARTLVIYPEYFSVNRPHLVIIRSLKTGAYLMLAKVLSP